MRTYQSGLSLIELMISMALGLILTLGVFSMFSSSQRSYQTNRELSVMQENAFFAFNFIAEPLREVGYMGGCSDNTPFANLVDSLWPSQIELDGFFANAMRAHTAASINSNTAIEIDNDSPEVLEVRGINTARARSATQAYVPGATDDSIVTLAATSPYAPGEVLVSVANDCQQISLFALSVVAGSSDQLVINDRNIIDEDYKNCRHTLFGTYSCADPTGADESERTASVQVYPVEHYYFYLAPNGQDLPSLYRHNAITGASSELVSGVSGLSFEFILAGTDRHNGVKQATRMASRSELDDTSNLNWGDVIGVRVNLQMQSERPINDGQVITRDYSHTIALRNRQVQ